MTEFPLLCHRDIVGRDEVTSIVIKRPKWHIISLAFANTPFKPSIIRRSYSTMGKKGGRAHNTTIFKRYSSINSSPVLLAVKRQNFKRKHRVSRDKCFSKLNYLFRFESRLGTTKRQPRARINLSKRVSLIFSWQNYNTAH